VKLDDAKLRDSLQAICNGPLTPAEAAVIVDVARFAASVDGRMDMAEMATVARLSRIVYAISGEKEAPVPATPMAAGWLADVGKKLASSGGRDLAYACAYLVILVDRKVTKEETELASKLTEALRIAPARAQELSSTIDTLVRG
jgi:hypothetical protein